MQRYLVTLALLVSSIFLLVPDDAAAQSCGLFDPPCASTKYCDGVPFNPQCQNRGGSTASCSGLGQGTCLSGLVCDVAGECRANPPNLGEVCGGTCSGALVCVSGRCATRRTVGQSCTGIGQGTCASSLVCDVSGVCRNNPPQAGQPCGTGVSCASGLTCSAAVGGTCIAPRTVGQTCTGAGQGTCASSLVCDVSGVCRNNPPQAGQPCGTGVSCASGLTCNAAVGGTCITPRAVGQSCSGVGQGTCATSLVCDVSGVCRNDPPQSGQPCGTGVSCASGLACSALAGGICQTPRIVGQTCVVAIPPAQGNCANTLVCDFGATVSQTICRNDPPQSGQTCGLAVACASGLTCYAAKCKAPGAAGAACDELVSNSCQSALVCTAGACRVPGAKGDACGIGLTPCASNLVCDVAGVCRTDPPTAGDPCAGFGQGNCASASLVCESAIGVGGTCVTPRAVGDSCAGVGQGSCQSGLICDGLDGTCRNNPPLLGQTCGALVACAADLVCVDTKCTTRGASGTRCNGLGRGSCEAGLVCDLGSGLCRHNPPARGEACGGIVGCVAPLACNGGVTGVCDDRRSVGQTCVGVGQGNCVDSAVCNLFVENDELIQKCFPEGNEAIPNALCSALYSPELSAQAGLLSSALTFSNSSSAAAGIAGSLSAGTVYGANGEYGCFTEACIGAEANVSASSSACAGIYTSYANVAGASSVTVQSVSLIPNPGPKISPEISTAQIFAPFDQGLQLQGTQTCLGVGVGLSPVPLSVGVYDCNSSVLDQNVLDSNGDGLFDYIATRFALNPLAPSGDTDGDSIPDVTELGGDLDRPLDSDGDGVIDALEMGSFATTAQIADGVPLPNSKAVRVTAAAGQLLNSVGGTGVAQLIDDVVFPLGSVGLRSTVAVGATTSIEFLYSEPLPLCPAVYGIGYEGVATLLAEAIWSKAGDSTIQVLITDGDSVTDFDGAADGMIETAIAIGANTADSNNNAYPDACEVPGDFDRDGDVDWNDVGLLLSRDVLNRPSTGPGDPRDMDLDGRITILDVRKAFLACDIPGCQIIN